VDFRLTDEQKMIIDSADKFGAKWGPEAHALREHQLERGEIHQDYWREFCEQGFMGALVPERYGGTDLGLAAATLILERISAHGLGNAMLMLTMMDALCILRAGPEALRERYLPKIVNGELIFAFSITEPEAGSNAFRMKTLAQRKGDTFVLNGEKTYITGVDVADKLLCVARSMPYEELKAKGLPKVSGFNLVVVDTDAPGLTKQELPTDGIEGLRQYTLYFDDVEVPAHDLIGEEHAGALAMWNVLNAERTLAAALSVGGTEMLLRKAVDYANERVVFGDKPIGTYQGVQHPLAECKAELEAARMLTYRAATMFDQNADPNEIAPYANMAKMLAGEVGIKACDRAIQTHGGAGFVRENGLLDAWINTRLVRTAPISKEMILNYIAEHVLGLPRSY